MHLHVFTINSMSSNKDDEASYGSTNEGNRTPNVQATTISSWTTSASGVGRFLSAAIEQAVRRNNIHAKRDKRLKTEMKGK